MLIVFSGLPGTGKTTLAREFARQLGAVYLRIDTIEQPLIAVHGDCTDLGYRAAYGIALDNLRLGHKVVADCVNPLNITRDAWRDVGLRAKVAVAEIEIVCSDAAEHRRRVETRQADILGHRLPTWEEVCNREAEPWQRQHIAVDTAGRRVEDCLVLLRAALASPHEAAGVKPQQGGSRRA